MSRIFGGAIRQNGYVVPTRRCRIGSCARHAKASGIKCLRNWRRRGARSSSFDAGFKIDDQSRYRSVSHPEKRRRSISPSANSGPARKSNSKSTPRLMTAGRPSMWRDSSGCRPSKAMQHSRLPWIAALTSTSHGWPIRPPTALPTLWAWLRSDSRLPARRPQQPDPQTCTSLCTPKRIPAAQCR